MENSITDRIFKILKDNDIKDSQLSRTLGVTRNSISEWRNGKTLPSPKQILKFLFHFPEVDANWLIRGTAIKPGEGQIITGNYNKQAGLNMVNDVSFWEERCNHLNEIILEKEKQIKLFEKLLNK
jgi:transcriptional regulator with XRE-family HTH domain